MGNIKKNHSLLLTFIIILLTFNTNVSNKKNHSKTTNKSADIENKNKTKNLINVKYSELFNVELVGLTKDSKINEKYYVDFSSACMCDTPSILLKEKKVYLFGFCKDTLPPLSKDPYYTYDILESKETNNGLSIFSKNTNDQKLSLFFNKSDTEFIYELKVIGDFPKDYIGTNLCKFFTYKVENFEIEDCGDFDG